MLSFTLGLVTIKSKINGKHKCKLPHKLTLNTLNTCSEYKVNIIVYDLLFPQGNSHSYSRL